MHDIMQRTGYGSSSAGNGLGAHCIAFITFSTECNFKEMGHHIISLKLHSVDGRKSFLLACPVLQPCK